MEPGAGGGGGEAPSVSVALQTRGDQARLVAGRPPMECETAIAGPEAVEECGRASLELFLPTDRLEVGPLIFTPDMRLQVMVAGGRPDDSDCFRTVITNNPNQKIVIEELTDDTVTVRLTGFGQDLDGDQIVDGLLDGSFTGPRCALQKEPLEIPAGRFVVLPGDPPRVLGSSDGASCTAPDQWSGDCDAWRVELTLPPELLDPGTLGDFEVEAFMEANMFSGDGTGSCGGGVFGGPTSISIEAVSESELVFVLTDLEFGTSIPISGRYEAPICP